MRFRIAEVVEVVKRLFVQSAELAAQIPVVDYGDDLEESEEDELERDEEGVAASDMATRAFQDSTQMFGSTATPTLGGSKRRRSTGRRKMKK